MDMEWFDRVIVARDRKIDALEATLKTERALMERQLAALTAERDAARSAADPDLSDYYEPAIVVTELQNENDALRRQLEEYAELHADLQRQVERQLAAAQEWTPVGAADPDIVCAYGTLVQVHGTSIAIGQQVTPDSDELVWSVAELPAGYALCTRQEPPA